MSEHPSGSPGTPGTPGTGRTAGATRTAPGRATEPAPTGGRAAGRQAAGRPAHARGPRPRPRRPSAPVALFVVLLAVLVALPFYIDEFWLRTGFAAFGAVVGAIGLNLLVGTSGQLSLAHAFFLAVGATSYVFFSGPPSTLGATAIKGLEWPPLAGMVMGVLLAGVAGLLFSPIAARLRGIYLGVASLALVFIGQHVLNTQTAVTGGFNGRTTPDFSLFGFHFADSDPFLTVAGVRFGQFERLWYLGLVLALGAYLVARNILRGRPGRALETIRDSEVAASVLGVNVQAYKARAFLVSSMYAGLSGVLLALSIGSIAPESFTLEVSIQYLAMIVLGGLGSVGGAAIGAVFVSATPLVLQQYADSLPFVGGGSDASGWQPGEVAALVYGAAIVIVILFEPSGLAGIARRAGAQLERARARARPPGAGPPRPAATST